MRRFVAIIIAMMLLAAGGQAQQRALQANDSDQQQRQQISQIEHKIFEMDKQIRQLEQQHNSLGRVQLKRLRKHRRHLIQILQSRRQRLSLSRLAQSLAKKNSAQRRIDKLQNDEQRLLRRARVVAQRIRSLRRQQKLAGQVQSNLRDQALFDEEERHLQLTRVVQRQQVNPAPDQADTRETAQGNSIDVSAAPASNDGEYGVGASDPVAPEQQNPTTTATVSQQIHAERVENIQGDYLPSLLNDSELPDDMQKLRQLRLQLVRQVERLSATRKKLEARERNARSTQAHTTQ